jgi:hypothetical protein
MKKLVLFISMAVCASQSFCQIIWDINFEDTATLHRVIIDTTSNLGNIWQTGHPDKAIFNAAHSDPNAIVTCISGTYPINDTSSFTIIHLAGAGWATAYPKVDIGGWYRVNSDSLTDYGFIDFSSDKGNTWFRADSNEGFCTWGAVEELPTFTGNSFGWKHFYYCLQVPMPVNYGDTILYRFTFISDQVQTNKDGLMFDDLHFEDLAEGIPEVQNDNLISITPNPVSDEFMIHRTNNSGKERVQMLNCIGQVVLDDPDFSGEPIDVRQLKNGIYLLRYSNTVFFSIHKIIIQH